MSKLENFEKTLEVLRNSDRNLAKTDEVYRAGIVGIFNLTFELSWKSLKEIFETEGIGSTWEVGSPRQILKNAYAFYFIDDDQIWIQMMKSRNISIHVYNEDNIIELVARIFDEFIPEFDKLLSKLKQKESENRTN